MPFDFNERPIRVFSIWPEDTCPIESSIYGWCQMACGYCFANLNRKVHGDEINPKNSLAKLNHTIAHAISDEYSALGHFLREKYPICFSNTTDPFQREEANYRCSEAFMRWAAIERQPLKIQTRGNVLYDDWTRYRDLIQPGKDAVYISICQFDDKIRRRYEPGALEIAKRWELVRMLADRGVPVIAAANPYMHEWLPDKNEYCRIAKEHGAQFIFVDQMHFTRNQAAQLAVPYRDLPEKSNIVKKLKRKAFIEWVEAANRHGMECTFIAQYNSLVDHRSYCGEMKREWFGGKLWDYQHRFLAEARQVADENPDEFVFFTVTEFLEFLAREGVPNTLFNPEDFWQAYNKCVDKNRREWCEALPNPSGFYDIIRFWANDAPESDAWFYHDDKIDLVENDQGEYLTDDEGNAIFSVRRNGRPPATEKDFDNHGVLLEV